MTSRGRKIACVGGAVRSGNRFENELANRLGQSKRNIDRARNCRRRAGKIAPQSILVNRDGHLHRYGLIGDAVVIDGIFCGPLAMREFGQRLARDALTISPESFAWPLREAPRRTSCGFLAGGARRSLCWPLARPSRREPDPAYAS